MRTPRLGEHRCPKPNCRQIIPNHLFACAPHWYELPRDLRRAIYATATRPLTDPQRAQIVRDAIAAWGPESAP